MRKILLSGAVLTSIISAVVGILRAFGVSLPLDDTQIATIGNAVAGLGGVVFSVLVASHKPDAPAAPPANVDGVGQKPTAAAPPQPPAANPYAGAEERVHPIDPFGDHGA